MSKNSYLVPSLQMRHVKLDFPKFDGSDPLDWLSMLISIICNATNHLLKVQSCIFYTVILLNTTLMMKFFFLLIFRLIYCLCCFVWYTGAQTAFDSLKAALLHAPTLALPDFSKPFVLETDASTKLLGYSYSIEYKPGPTNAVADALSRSFLMALSFLQSSLIDHIRNVVALSSELQQLISKIEMAPHAFVKYSIRDGLLFYKGRVLIPSADRSLAKLILQEFHSSRIGGHVGFLRTFSCVASHFYWDKMRSDVRVFVCTCQVRQRAKKVQTYPARFLSPLPIPSQV
uniref:Transposon Ty3-I Gag-Pol polyprotein n=1 Tax=Cajanus cajan TaxID=3821 RepID=A0A151QSR6_CAJCA|nr:Transposon Ty3-I Gag-Pol polyprotein [Cajanus cajan]